MAKMTRTAFNKLTGSKLNTALPAEVTVSGKTVFHAVASVVAPQSNANYTDDELVKLLINNDTDSVHVADARHRITLWKNGIQPPTPTPVPTTPLGSEADISKPYWLGEWSGNVGDSVRNIIKEVGTNTPLLVMYNIPGRDNGNYSAGGLKTAQQYYDWAGAIAAAIGTSKAIVILEPDAVGLSQSLSESAKTERYNMLQGAIDALKSKPNVKVYIDSSIWSGVDKSVEMLKKFKGLDGFACNVSGYLDMGRCGDYAIPVHEKTGLNYVIDTSRNGNGAPHGPDKWCNQTDTKVGTTPTMNPAIVGCDALLWVKVPGESDGLGINDDGTKPRTDVPSAGTMWPEFRDAIYSGDWTAFKAKYKV
jgi:endoglucanase